MSREDRIREKLARKNLLRDGYARALSKLDKEDIEFLAQLSAGALCALLSSVPSNIPPEKRGKMLTPKEVQQLNIQRPNFFGKF